MTRIIDLGAPKAIELGDTLYVRVDVEDVRANLKNAAARFEVLANDGDPEVVRRSEQRIATNGVVSRPHPRHLSRLSGFAPEQRWNRDALRNDVGTDGGPLLAFSQKWCALVLVLTDALDSVYSSLLLYVVTFLWCHLLVWNGLMDSTLARYMRWAFLLTYVVIWRGYFAKYQGTDFKFNRQPAHYDIV